MREAEESLLTAIRIYRDRDEPMYHLGALCELGGVVHDQGRLAEAASLYDEAERVIRSRLGPTHPWLISVHTGLARTHEEAGDVELANRNFAAAVELATRHYGSTHHHSVWKMSDFALFLVKHGELQVAKDACKEFERALTVGEQKSAAQEPSFETSVWEIHRRRLRDINRKLKDRAESPSRPPE